MTDIYDDLKIDKDIVALVNKAEFDVKNELNKIDACEYVNSLKVLKAFHQNNLSENHLNGTTGYGYSDSGREVIEKIYCDIFGAEDALVRNQFVSGTHALTVALFALLRPNDTLLSISGTPYDTLKSVIGIDENASSLKSYGVKYEQIDLIDNEFDLDKIKETLLTKKIKVIEIQRSKGYSTRKTISIEQIKKVIDFIRKFDEKVIVMVDNCYCEFVETTSPLEVGADLIVGSLIKNLGAGIARNGAYICGKKELVELCGERLTCPGQGKEVGASLECNREFLEGLYFAPHVVASSVKTAILTSKVLEDLGYSVEPRYNEKRSDIVELIKFGNEQDLISYTRGVQMGSPVDAKALPVPADMPGYDHKIIMASGSFVQGSSIEFSCDAPLKEPFIAYQQGSLSYQYGKIGLMKAVQNLRDKK